jgi:hypothetical protein
MHDDLSMKAPINLRDSLAESRAAVRAHGNGLVLLFDVPPGVPEALHGDPSRAGPALRGGRAG